jgi:uncharacterized protein (DUF427 family)
VVKIDGQVVADSKHQHAIFETGLIPRWYLPQSDVRMDLLTPTDTHTGCPYKGWASYWSAEVNGTVHKDVVWSYEDPLREALPVKGLVSFYNERVDLTVDGEKM